jgi:hypothetical protein
MRWEGANKNVKESGKQQGEKQISKAEGWIKAKGCSTILPMWGLRKISAYWGWWEKYIPYSKREGIFML